MNITHFRQLDWDFPDQNSKMFLHNLCWYPSRFIPMIPAQLIAALSYPDDMVMDPFGGSGTVLLEALRQNRSSVCIDLNPVGTFIAKTKARVFSGEKLCLESLSVLSEEICYLLQEKLYSPIFDKQSKLQTFAEYEIKNYALIRPWYHHETLKDLVMLYGYIESISDNLTRDILRLIFISILMPSSGHKTGRPYTYYADNVKPKELLKKDVYSLYSRRLDRFISEYQCNPYFGRPIKNWEVINGDTRDLPERLEGVVDLIVTSPPYVSVTDYSTAFRLAHLWYEWDYGITNIKEKEIGPRWRRKRADAMLCYLKDLEDCFGKLEKALKPKKHLCLVIGESKNHSNKIKDHLIANLLNANRFELVHTASRELSQKFFIHPSGGVKTEDILIFRKK